MNIFKKAIPIILSLCLISSNCGANNTITQAVTGVYQDSNTTQYPKKYYSYTNGYNNFSSLVVPTVLNTGDYCSISGKLLVGNLEKNYRMGICVCPSNYFSDNIDTKLRNKNSCASYLSNYKSDTYYDLSELDNYIYFNKLAAGKYCYSIYMINSNYEKKELYKSIFIVQNTNVSRAYVMNNIAFSEYTLPSEIKRYNSFSLKGNITALYGFYNSTTCYPSYATGYIYYPGESGDNYYNKKSVSIKLNETRRKVAFPQEIDNAMLFNYLIPKNDPFAYVMSLTDSKERYMIVKSFKVKQ